ncbi:MAG TPA: hypothetical protein VMZ71_14950, partial [Gemmataceae bacterium]|nr:hypothetical protein [Gemmataceae bacterium]
MFLVALALAAPPSLVPELPPTTAPRPGHILEVSADGTWAALYASGRDRSAHLIQVWNLGTGALERTLPYENTGYDYRPVIDPRGKWAAYTSLRSDGYHLQIIDFRTGELTACTPRLSDGSRSLGFSGDGKEVYVADREYNQGWIAHAYSTADGSLLRHFWVPDVRRFDLAPDGRTAVIEYTSVWDLSTGKKVRGGMRNGPTVGFPNGAKEVATFGYQGNSHPIIVTNITTGKVVSEIAVPRGKVNDQVRLSADGRTLAVFRHGTYDLEVFEVGQEQPRFTLREFTRHPDQMRFTPDGTGLIALDKFGRFTVIDTQTGKRRHALDPDYREVRSLAFADGGKVLIAGMGTRFARRFYTDYDMTPGQVVLWDATTGGLKHAVAGLPHDTAGVFASPKLDHAIIVSGEKGNHAEWRDLNTGKLLRDLGTEASHFAASRDGRFVAGVTARVVAMWEPATGKRLDDIAPHENAEPEPCPPHFTPDGEWLLVRRAGVGVQAFRVSNGKPTMLRKWPERFRDPPGTPLALPHGDAFVSRCTRFEYMAGDICLFTDGRRIRFGKTDQFHTPLVISPDGTWVASGQSVQHLANPVFLWAVPVPGPFDEKKIVNGVIPPEEQPVAPRLLHAHAERVTAVAFSPDGKTLATGGTDRVIRLWDVETATLRAVLWAAPSPDPDAAPTD